MREFRQKTYLAAELTYTAHDLIIFRFFAMLQLLLELIFFTGIGIMFYTYLGYAIVLRLFPVGKNRMDEDDLPAVTVVVPVFNEAGIMEKKISNCLALQYPEHLLQFVFVNDGSTDETVSIIREHSFILLVQNEKREGKTAALNKAMQEVKTPLVIFSDASAILNPLCIQKMVRHFADEKVGGVSGEKKILKFDAASMVSNAEQLYWKYESFLKKTDALFYSVVGADGALFAIRSPLYKPVDPSVILDDFFISVNICDQGYRLVYEPEAFALEPPSSSIAEERKRKIRISAGCFQALVKLPHLLNPFKNFRFFLVYFSHRVLRWIACPALLPVLLFVNVLLVATTGSVAYQVFLVLQVTFYLAALAGWATLNKPFRIQLFLIPYYFVFMNLSLYLGFVRFLAKKQTVMWEKTERMPGE